MQDFYYLCVLQEEDDGIYESEESVDEDTDSDISIDENDELKSDDEDESKKKKRRVVTKAYKVCLFYSKEKKNSQTSLSWTRWDWLKL